MDVFGMTAMQLKQQRLSYSQIRRKGRVARHPPGLRGGLKELPRAFRIWIGLGLLPRPTDPQRRGEEKHAALVSAWVQHYREKEIKQEIKRSTHRDGDWEIKRKKWSKVPTLKVELQTFTKRIIHAIDGTHKLYEPAIIRHDHSIFRPECLEVSTQPPVICVSKQDRCFPFCLLLLFSIALTPQPGPTPAQQVNQCHPMPTMRQRGKYNTDFGALELI